jgi:ribosome-associated protein
LDRADSVIVGLLFDGISVAAAAGSGRRETVGYDSKRPSIFFKRPTMPPRHEPPRPWTYPQSQGEPPAAAPGAPSKTQRKATMHALQDLGVSLVELDARRLSLLASEVGLPERLIDAINQARTITAWGGRKRQLQYVGKLMRDIDPDPIRRRLDAWAHGHHLDVAREHAIEQWRDRLLAEPDALDALCALHPTLDRPRLRALIAQARTERSGGGPPHAFRELFRALKDVDGLVA